MKWEHVLKVLDPKTAVREVHISLVDKELVIKDTPDGRRETYMIDTAGAKVVYMPFTGGGPFDKSRQSGADYTKTAPFDCTAEYLGDCRENNIYQ